MATLAAPPVHDTLNVATDSTFLSCLATFRANPANSSAFCGVDPATVTETVLLSAPIIKINRKGKRQKRAIVITDLALYNFAIGKYKAFKRRIPMHNLDKIISVTGVDGAQFVVHPWEMSDEYDYHYDAESPDLRSKAIAAVQYAYKALLGADLAHVELEPRLLQSILVTKQQIRARGASRAASASVSVISRRRDSVRKSISNRSRPSLTVSGRMQVATPVSTPTSKLATIPDESLSDPSAGAGSGGGASDSAPTLPSSSSSASATAAAAAATPTDPSSSPSATASATAAGAGGAVVSPPVAAAAHVSESLTTMNTSSPGNQTLEGILEWEGADTPLGAARMLAEALLHRDTTEAAIFFFSAAQDAARGVLDDTEALVQAVGVDEAQMTRAWATRALHKLVAKFREKGVMVETMDARGGVEGYVLDGFLKPDDDESRVTALEPAVYSALLGLLIGLVVLPSQQDVVPEPFGKAISAPELLPIVFRALPTAPWELRRDIVKDLNVLLVKRESNFTIILQNKMWQTWFAPLLAIVPQAAGDRTEVQAEYLKYVMNLFAMILYHVYSRGDDVDKVLYRFFLQLALQAGWAESGVGVARSILSSLVVKIGNGAKRWKNNYDRPEWNNLFKVANVVEAFIFYMPCETLQMDALIAEEAGQATLLTLKNQLALPAAPQPLASEAPPAVDSSNIGIHLSMENTAEDLKLAKRVCAVMGKIGITSAEGGAPTPSARSARATVTHAVSVLKTFEDISRFLEEDIGGDDTAVLEALGKFLEKRQKKSTGFLTKGTNKKHIVKSLQTSLMRQQAQKTIRSQVRSKVAVATAAIVMEADSVQEERVSDAKQATRVRGAEADGLDKEAAVKAALAGGEDAAAAATGSGSGGAEESKSGGDGSGGSGSGAAGAGTDADGDVDGPDASNETQCASCEQPLLNDDGVFALGKLFHVDCFTCSHCEKPFRDSPYYERKGRAYCREDYLTLFARSVCAGCMAAFRRGDSAMEALGKMWHPQHFQCACCARVFEPEETFFDKEGRPYCGPCNERLFMTCPACSLAVTDDQDGVSALDKNWHRECFVCAFGGCKFDDGTFYSKDAGDGKGERPYCEEHYMELFVPKCHKCSLPVKESGLAACGFSWHSACFGCAECGAPFPDGQYFEADGQPYCADDYWRKFGQKCAKCGDVIREATLNALGQTWHPDCFTCTHCDSPFPEMSYFEKDKKPYCEKDFAELFCEHCPKCGEYVLDNGRMALDKTWHANCLVCTKCGVQLEESAHQGDDGQVYCREHFLELFSEACARCGKTIEGDAVADMGKQWHVECFVCTHCEAPLVDVYRPFEGQPYCEEHFVELFGTPCHRCGNKVSPSLQLKFMDKIWHAECLTCSGPCGRALDPSVKIFPRDGEPFCEDCFLGSCDKCADCRKPVIGTCLTVLGRKYHKGCLKCFACGTEFENGKMYQRSGFPVCKDHIRGELDPDVQQKFDDTMKEEKEAKEGGGGGGADAAAAAAPAPAAPPPPPPAAAAAGEAEEGDG